jgi:hypothetical protein
MANSIQTTGMGGGTITTTHKSGESVSEWVSRHTDNVDQGMPGSTLKTTWPCASGQESVTTSRDAGESDHDFILRHEADYMLAMIDCPPVP